MKSRKVCVIAMETINITKTIGEIDANMESEREDKIIAEIRFMWIPGKRPVIVPAMRPMKRASISSINISRFIY
jgi:hypothetical protein